MTAEQEHLFAYEVDYFFTGRGEALLGDRIGKGVYGFSALETYCDKGDEDGRGYTDARADLDFSFYPGLCRRISEMLQRSQLISRTLTRVAEMPGYPTRKLELGGPETRTSAAMI